MKLSRSVLPHPLALALIAPLALAPLAATPAQAQDAETISAALGDIEWRHIGPVNMGGRVSAIIGVPGDPRTFWVGAANGGVWKTTNGGVTFEHQWDDENTYSVGALTLAPSDHNVLWLGAGEADPRNSVSYGDGVYRSTDGGATWTHLGLDDSERIKRIVVDPRDPDVALVCAMGHEWGPNRERGVFRTTDGGQSWDHVLFIDEDTGCSDMDIDLTNPRNVYAGMWTFRRKPWRFDDGGRETALYVSRDGGISWKKITTTPNEPMARIGVSVAQSRPNIVYLITEYPTAGTLFMSDDYGETWTMVNDNKNLINFRPFYYSDVYVDPSDHETLYTLSGALAKSTDGGRTFERIANDVHGDHQAYWIDPADGERVLSGSDGGMQVSYDGGANFHIFRNFSLAQYYHIFVDDRDPYYVCGGLQDNGNWCGPSRLNDRRGILPGYFYTVSGGDGFYTVPVPGQPNLIYSNAQGGYFRITDINSGQMRSIEPWPLMIGSQGQGMFQARYRFNWDAPIVISPHDPGTVYWGGNVVFRSRDYGHSWDVISPDLTTDDPEKQLDSGGEIYLDNTAAEFHTTILTIAEDEFEPGVIWVGTDDGNVQITRDNGANWTNVRDRVPGLPAETWIGNIEASPTDAGAAYMAVDNHRLDDFTPHLYETRDYGQSWRDISAGLPQDDYVKVVRQHPSNPNLLFVGMDRGIFASWDRGDTWVDIRGNLPRVSVRGVKIQRQYNDLVIGTHGRGAWILDDIQPMVELTEAIGQDAHLFDIRLATEWEMWGRTSNFGQSRFAGENPDPGAWIHFHLSADAAEAAGQLRRRAHHRRQWNARARVPVPRPRAGRQPRDLGPPLDRRRADSGTGPPGGWVLLLRSDGSARGAGYLHGDGGSGRSRDVQGLPAPWRPERGGLAGRVRRAIHRGHARPRPRDPAQPDDGDDPRPRRTDRRAPRIHRGQEPVQRGTGKDRRRRRTGSADRGVKRSPTSPGIDELPRLAASHRAASEHLPCRLGPAGAPDRRSDGGADGDRSGRSSAGRGALRNCERRDRRPQRTPGGRAEDHHELAAGDQLIAGVNGLSIRRK